MGAHRLVACLATATVSFATISALLPGLLVWKVALCGPKTPEDTMDAANIAIILEKYPGYFRTPEKQIDFERATIRRPVTVAHMSSVYERYFTEVCRPSATREPFASHCVLDDVQQSELTFHGCCISYSEPITPTHLPTAEPNQSGDVELVQFRRWKQHFETEKCCQARDCTGCQCTQTYYRTSAVVKRPHPNGGTRYVTEWVRVPGCCKCLNIGSGKGHS